MKLYGTHKLPTALAVKRVATKERNSTVEALEVHRNLQGRLTNV